MGKLLEEIKNMPLAERYLLIEEIWNTIDREQEAISDEVKHLIDQRLAAYEAAPQLASEEGAVFGRVRAKRRK